MGSSMLCNQTIIFLYSVLGGALIGLVYDIFRVKRRLIKTGDVSTHIEDFLFWLIVAIIMFLTLFYSNEGEFRIYTLMGNIIGLVLYVCTVSNFVINSTIKIIRIICITMMHLFRIVIYPIKIIYKTIKIPIIFIIKYFKKMFKFLIKFFKIKFSGAIEHTKKFFIEKIHNR